MKGRSAWYWKQGLNVEYWKGANLPPHLLEAGVERCWIKVTCSSEPIYLCVVYMPTEDSGESKSGKMDQILEVMDLDQEELISIKATSLLYGDFNSHIGDPSDSSLGIPGNNQGIGDNGFKLLTWLKKWDKLVVNSEGVTKGL